MATHSSVLAWRIPGTAEPGAGEGLGARPGTPSPVLVGDQPGSGPLTNFYSLTLRGTLLLELECVSFMLRVTLAPFPTSGRSEAFSPPPALL